MSTALWVVAAAVVLVLLVWRLWAASRTLGTILREERDREPEPDLPEGDGAPHEVGRRRQDT
jgi:hypothetical protein